MGFFKDIFFGKEDEKTGIEKQAEEQIKKNPDAYAQAQRENIPTCNGCGGDIEGKQTEQDNPNWKGDNATNLTTFHKRVERKFGNPCFCAICKTIDEENTYDWACLTGKYEDINDYKRLCRSCHKKYDLARLGKGLITMNELPLSKRDKEIVSSIAVKWVKCSLGYGIGEFKSMEDYERIMKWIKHFFNLTSEDLK